MQRPITPMAPVAESIEGLRTEGTQTLCLIKWAG